MTRRQRRAFIQDAKRRKRARRHPLPGSAAYMDDLARGINAALRALFETEEQVTS